ncbi:MAG TPA: IS110 family transposase [Alphaproteobacteria bacterium]|nr:IS110 family transposase [Alphaproteobacteria bacterium]
MIAVIELSQKSWLIGGVVPGLEREPLKKLEPDPEAVLKLLHRWREEAGRNGRRVTRITVAFEAGRDGLWLARWLLARGIEAYVIHPTSVAVSREHNRAKTDRIDIRLLKRSFLGWLRGEPEHCRMVAIASLAAEDARRPGRERERLGAERTRLVNQLKSALARLGVRHFNPLLRRAPERLDAVRTPEGVPIPRNTQDELRRMMTRLRLVKDQIKELKAAGLARLETAPNDGPQAMVGLLAKVFGIGIDTAETLVHEALSRQLRDGRALARYAGLTGSPDESGKRRREKGLARAGNARVRHCMVQLAWRFPRLHKDSELARWYRARTQAGSRDLRKTMIVALARKLLIALWRYASTGIAPEGFVLREAV